MHSHSQDHHSWHILLSPHDANEVVAKGWGEYLPRVPLPLFSSTAGLVLVYAPRDVEEVRVFKEILLASCGYARCLALDGEKKERGEKKEEGGGGKGEKIGNGKGEKK